MADPVLLSVSNVALPTSGAILSASVTVPTGANACVVGGTFYLTVATTLSTTGAGWLTVQAQETYDRSNGDWQQGYSARCKVTATGSQTLTVSRSDFGSFWNEGPTCQIAWLTVEDPDDWVSGFARDGQNASPDTLTGTVTSETNGIVLAFAGVDSSSGGVSAPSTPANTLQGSTQTINSDSGGVYRITTPGSSTTTVTLPSKNYPTLFVVGVKAGSGGGGATNLTLQGASHAHTTDSLTLSTSSVIAVNSAAHAQSAAITEEVFITVQPTDQTGVVGETETYSVAAVGIGLTYQWFRKEPV